MSTFVNNNVSSGDVVRASDHNTQGANIAAVINGNIETENISDGAITNAKLAFSASEIGGEWTLFTPSWTDFTLGNGTEEHYYKKIGKIVQGWGYVILGSTSVMNLSISLTAPVTRSSKYSSVPSQTIIGVSNAFDVSAGKLYPGNTTLISSNNEIGVNASLATATYLEQASYNTSVPFAWASGDTFTYSYTYEAA